jgi:hypothetical protein
MTSQRQACNEVWAAGQYLSRCRSQSGGTGNLPWAPPCSLHLAWACLPCAPFASFSDTPQAIAPPSPEPHLHRPRRVRPFPSRQAHSPSRLPGRSTPRLNWLRQFLIGPKLRILMRPLPPPPFRPARAPRPQLPPSLLSAPRSRLKLPRPSQLRETQWSNPLKSSPQPSWCRLRPYRTPKMPTSW